MELRRTVDDRPHWSICAANRFSRVGGVTRVQLARLPATIFVPDPEWAERPAAEVVRLVEWWASAQGMS